jgi:hypothetical protein
LGGFGRGFRLGGGCVFFAAEELHHEGPDSSLEHRMRRVGRGGWMTEASLGSYWFL